MTSKDRRRGVPLGLRIASGALAALLSATLVAGLYLASRLHDLSVRSIEQGADADAALLVAPVRRALEAADVPALQEIVNAARGTGRRVTIVLPDGSVAAESDQALPLPPHGDRPEIREAMERGRGASSRHSATLDEAMLYVSRRVDGADGRPLGVVRVARGMGAAKDLDAELIRVFAIAAALGLPVASLVGWLTARHIARPLEELTVAATRMAGGDFSRLPHGMRDDEAGRLADALRTMGERTARTLAAVEASLGELTAILESMTEGIIALGTDERVLHANRSAADCLQLAEVPRPGAALMQLVRLPEISAAVRAALRGETGAESDVPLPGAAGRILSVGAAPIRAADGAVRGAVLVLRDVTVMRRLERTRLDFVANVSHELRTPLAAMSSAMETVQSLGPEESETRAQMVGVALRHAKRLAAIVDDLLALSQIESEGDRLERGPVPLSRALRQAAAAVAPAAAGAGVTLEMPRDADEITVLGHEGRLEQVWVNLLANAVKYNRPGGTVQVAAARDDARREACVTIRDTGQGIPAEAIPRIFERFYRVDKGRSREQGGTGLGLAIVKHIVRAHRGSIEVESEPGVGSTFTVRLPLGA